MYDQLFDIQHKYLDQTITPEIMKIIGMKEITNYGESLCNMQTNDWWSDEFQSGYFSIHVDYTESVFDVIKMIITADVTSFAEDMAEEAAGAGW